MTVKRINLSVRVREDLVDRLDAKIKELDRRGDRWNKQRVFDGLLEDWLGGKRSVSTESKSSDRYQQDLERLLDVLEHAAPKERELLRGLIQHHAEALHGRPENVKVMPPNPSRSSSSPKKSAHPAR